MHNSLNFSDTVERGIGSSDITTIFKGWLRVELKMKCYEARKGIMQEFVIRDFK